MIYYCFLTYFVSWLCVFILYDSIWLTVETPWLPWAMLDVCYISGIKGIGELLLLLVKGCGLTLVPPNGMLLCPIVGRQHTSPAAPTTSTAALAQEGMCGAGIVCLPVFTVPACLARRRMTCPERTDSLHTLWKTHRQANPLVLGTVLLLSSTDGSGWNV